MVCVKLVQLKKNNMKRSYELLIAEQLQKGGYLTDIGDAIHHMNKEDGYSSVEYPQKQYYTVVTVVFTQDRLVVYNINHVDEKITLVTEVGVL